ncbi:hypothetical protein ACOSP7_024026 [Xanthoceras sorbifolium]
MAGVEEVVVQEPSRGRDANPSRSRKDKSRDAASILESRLARIELAIADSRERLDVLEQCIFQARLENTVMGKLAEFETFLEDMRGDWALCKRAVSGGAFQGAPKKEIPKPKEFDGKRDAKEVDNFIWHMERYFEAEGLQHDSLGKSLVGLANDGKTKRFWVQDDLLYTVGNWLYVPKFGNLRKNLIKECHDTKWAGHLKPYHADTEDPGRGESSRAPTAVVNSYDKEVEEILADRVVRKRGVPQSSEYLIKWKGLPTSEATWELKEALWQFSKQIEEFHKETTTRTSPD